MSLKHKIRHKGEDCRHCELSTICLPSDRTDSRFIATNNLVNNYYELKAGESLCSSGENFDYLYVIRSGAAKDANITANGEEQISDFYLPGEIIGLDAISTLTYPFNTIMLKSSKVCIVPYKKLAALAKKNPKLQSRLLYLTSKKLLDRTHLSISKHNSPERRVAAFLIDISERNKARELSSKDFYLAMSRHDIGNNLNLASETISRVLTKFQNEGILTSQKKHIHFLNLSKLKAKMLVDLS